MSRPKSKMPTYRYHLSGQAVVTLDGRDFYLGPHQSAISLARYAALIRIYQKNNLTLPEHIRVDDVELGIQAVDTALAAEPTHQNRQPAKVRDAIAAYRVEIEKKYASSPQEHHRHRRICTMLDDGYGNFSAQDFGPVKLREFRDVLVESGNSRKYVNRLTRIVVGLFRHAVSEELIDVDIVKRLETLPPLKRNQTSAPETQRRRPVRLEVVRATAAHLSPVLKAMLRVQLSTGMRPKELCSIRPTDIDKSGEHWMYRPGDHKTAHHDIEKAVPIVDDARDALTD